jgi:hypothetical protein
MASADKDTCGTRIEHTLTLRQADQARGDFALIEEHLEFLAGQLARIPTRKEQAGGEATVWRALRGEAAA